ncbi:hypothetical protein GH723_05280 [Actinomarinicola tropica]|uniref:Uncharacterized protein n=1 Tax=Actinomarinicola tropica TaxID=2789776 RepID=A0A5Q2RMY9_9ACTN|nr:hypothetical protein GH723_05280 [Actinomarinicola tropica]
MATAQEASDDDRRQLATALLTAILEQPSYGPDNLLDAGAFALLLDAVPDQVEAALDPAADRHVGGQRYLRQHVFTIPGPSGAMWLERLIRADDTHAYFLFTDMRIGKLPTWSEVDWSDRLDAIARVASEPRPTIVRMLSMATVPRSATPALVRVAIAHGTGPTDSLVRGAAATIRSHRRGDESDLELIDWEAHRVAPELHRWLLELSGESGERDPLVAAARSAGRIDDAAAAILAAPLDRPAWADGEVPWTVAEVVTIGEVDLPGGTLTGGDPWYTGGHEGFPWTVRLEAEAARVDVVVVEHPLYGRECAALHLVTAGAAPVDHWEPVAGRVVPEGYHVEIGIAGFGSVAAYEGGAIPETDREEVPGSPHPFWHLFGTDDRGGLALCSVGPQHQVCRTWVGRTEAGHAVAAVTDLGLLDLDLAATVPTWLAGPR